MRCSETLYSLDGPQFIEIIKYAIREVNMDENLLKNITLGHIILDTCTQSTVALARALSLVSTNLKTNITRGRNPGISTLALNGQNGKEMGNIDNNEYDTFDCGNRVNFFDNVAGTIGPGFSSASVLVASLLGLFEIPVLATFSTSDELSDKSRFNYFMRMVPPDR